MMSELNRFNAFKILVHADRLRVIARGGYPYPLDWHIYPSNICNHTCSWCMFRQNGEQDNFAKVLPRKLLLKAVEDAARTGAILVHFSGGGEPLINKSTLEAMRLATQRGLKVALSTNGALLTPEVAASVDYIRVSLNAGTEEQHRKTNHAADPEANDWKKILENIRACVPSKRQDLGLGFVVDHDNWKDIHPFCGVAADLKVDFVHIRPAFWYDAKLDQNTREAMLGAFNESERAKKDFGDKVPIFAIADKFDGYWNPRTYNRCKAVLTGVCLRATGDFAVCQDRMDLTFGTDPNWADGATFEEVWHSPQHHEIVDSITSPGALDACPRCVWNMRNKIITDVFEADSMRLALV